MSNPKPPLHKAKPTDTANTTPLQAFQPFNQFDWISVSKKIQIAVSRSEVSANCLPLTSFLPFNQGIWTNPTLGVKSNSSRADVFEPFQAFLSVPLTGQNVQSATSAARTLSPAQVDIFVNLLPIGEEPGLDIPFASFDWSNPATARASGAARITQPGQLVPGGGGPGEIPHFLPIQATPGKLRSF